MQEVQVIYWRTEPFELESRQSAHFVRPVWMHSPEFIKEHGEGWVVIACNIAMVHESGDLVMAATMTRDIATDEAGAVA